MNDEYKDICMSLLKRSLLAVPFFTLSFFLLFRDNRCDLLQGFAMGLLGCAGIIAGATIVAFPLVRLIAEPSGSLFWPSEHFDRPQPMYSIPQSKRAKGLYEEALAGFEKIAEDYPEELQPYVEMIDIAIVNLMDPDRANRIYQKGLSTLKREEAKEALTRMFNAIRTRLHARPGNEAPVHQAYLDTDNNC